MISDLGRERVRICQPADRNCKLIVCVEHTMTLKKNTPRLLPAPKCEPDREPCTPRCANDDSARRVWDYIAARKRTRDE